MTLDEYFSLSDAEKVVQLQENYYGIVFQAMQRLLELDSVPVSERAFTNYTIGNMTVSWGEYRQSLLDLLRSAKEIVESLAALAPPFSLHYRVK